MKKIIVTEKPSVARTFAQVLGVTEKAAKGYYENDEWIITWCVGHLVTMSYPEVYDEALKKWDLETLPFMPKTYKYEIIKTVKDQFYVIKGLYNRKDIEAIYYAGDPAREGIYIQALVRQMAGHTHGIDEKVVWIDSQTAEEIKKGIKNAKPLKEYANLIDAGYMRAIEDYLLGINFSRLLSVKYGDFLNNAAKTSKTVPVAVGRVMTCVLAMIIDRERAIRDFKETFYYRITADSTTPEGKVFTSWKVTDTSKVNGSPKLYNDTGFLKKEDAEDFIRSLPSNLIVNSVEETIEKKNAPFLFNLAELQYECSKRFKMSPDETLAVAQELYDKKLTTYPRTDARVLSSAIAKEIEPVVAGLTHYIPVSDIASALLRSGKCKDIIDSRYTDDAKVNDHYAIIPTGEGSNLLKSCETPNAAEVYDLIVRRFLSIFCPPAEYSKVKVVAYADKERFSTSTRELVKKGYLAVYDDDKDEDEPAKDKETSGEVNQARILKALHKGDSLPSVYQTAESKTSPPKRYTSGSMILAMENAGQLIEDPELRSQIKSSGIGTSATRDAIIKKLVGLHYIDLNKKTQVLTPGSLGDLVYEIVKATIPTLLSPKMTASWERGLSEIENGKVASADYRAKLETYIDKETARVKTGECDKDVILNMKPFAKERNFENIQRARYESFKNNGDKPKGTYAIKAQTYIDVPFDDKDKVKALGARFDGNTKMWYVPEGVDVELFGEWKKVGKSEAKRGSSEKSKGSFKPDTGKKTYLKVSFDDKDKVKALGARFDGEKKQWYAPEGADLDKFKQWLE